MPGVPNKDTTMALGDLLINENLPLKERFRALFTLRNLGGSDAVIAISRSFSDPSALLKHECAYCLGQMQDTSAVPFLIDVLKDKTQDVMVRHEAGEALGAIGTSECLDVLKEYCKDPQTEVAETCQLAVSRIDWLNSAESADNLPENPYASVDPAPPCPVKSIPELKSVLLDESLPLFQRYRAMFTLRNIGGSEAALALAEGLKCSSALFRHEIAYVLGQMQEEAGKERLAENLKDESESPMVRHECAEALGSIATEDCTKLLANYLEDKEIVVKESCVVALDMSEYHNSDQFQYADGLDQIRQQNIDCSAD